MIRKRSVKIYLKVSWYLSIWYLSRAQFLWHSDHCWFSYELLNLLGLLKEFVYLPDCTERNHENKLFFAEPGFQPLKIRIRKRSANN
jgi:hypothetical protein